MFIPIGLASAIFRFPWITFLILFAVLFASAKKFKDVEGATQTLLFSEHKLKLLQMRLQLISAACDSSELLTPGECKNIKKLGDRKFYALGEPLLEFQQSTGKSKGAAASVEKLKTLIYEDSLFRKKILNLASSEQLAAFQAEEALFNQEMKASLAEHGLLSKLTMSWKSLLTAQFIHAGYIHLIGNLLIFIFLSIHAELRLGFVVYPLLYLLAGFVGLGLQILVYDNPSTFLVGASANIAGVAGAYTVLFWRRKLRVLFYGLLYYRLIWIPVSLFFPVLFLSSDLVGALQAESSGVAHLAHLGGFTTGALGAYLFMRWQNLPQEMSFPIEQKIAQQIHGKSVAETMTQRLELLNINPDNTHTHQQIIDSVADFSAWSSLKPQYKYYFACYFADYFQQAFKQHAELLNKTLCKVSSDWPLKKVFQGASAKSLVDLLSICKGQNQTYAALIVYNALFALNPSYIKNPDLLRDYNELIDLHKLSKGAHGHVA